MAEKIATFTPVSPELLEDARSPWQSFYPVRRIVDPDADAKAAYQEAVNEYELESTGWIDVTDRVRSIYWEET